MIELNTGEHQSKSRGQAMVEYALILALLAVSFGFAIAATGPAIGNVFCNVVANLGGSEVSAQGAQKCGSAAPDLVLAGGDPNKFWATVTWVAGHPQGETPFPTPIRRAPTAVSGLQTSTPTPTASNTPTNTATFTATNTNTATLVPTAGPSPTTSDFTFTIPFVDQINNKEWWRTDLADTWKAQWYNSQTHGAITASGYALTLSQPKNQTTIVGSNSYAFDFTTSAPPANTGVTVSDGFGASFTRTFQLTQATSILFSVQANDVANVYLDGATPPILWNLNITTANTRTMVVPSGMHTIRIDYAEDTNNSNLNFFMTPGATTAGTPDAPEQDNSCSWGQTSGANNPVSVSFMFEANPGQSAWPFPAGQTCYLELRGYVDLNAHANPVLSFWDIWDFVGASGLTAQLQIGKYTQVAGSVDRTAFNWQTIATHAAGSKNYAWTRNQIDLTTYKASLGNNVTFRYVIGGTGGTTFRWFLDDLQVLDAPTSNTPYTINKTWSLDTTDQMDDFIFDGDSFRSIQKYGLPTTGDPWRWQLTSNNAHGGMGWDDSPSGVYQNITGLSPNPTGTADPRIHFLQFRNNIDLTGTLPADTDNDTGNPLLTFWQAYDIKTNASIRVEYAAIGSSTWTAIPNQGILLDYAVPTGTSRTSLTMQPLSIDLTNIPNWNTAAFQLRFAMYIDGAAATTFGQGWYIDDIKIEREKQSPYVAYPFVDDAESASFSANTWQAIGGKWNRTVEKGGALNTATAYSDSPLTTYDPGDTQELQMKYAIDLQHDTVANTSDAAGRPAAVNPVLTFWHQRNITAGATFSVELWTASTNTWTQVWVYNASSDPFPTEKAWQRVEINLQTATALADAVPWATISGNGNGVLNDDDIKVRFRFDSGASVAADGVYVDEIHIENASATTQNLWPTASGGDGPFVDSVENVSPLILGGSLTARWYEGGQWNTTNAAGYYKSSSLAFADSPSGNYLDNSFSVLEMVPIINLTNTPVGSTPMMTFWTRYNIGATATFRVDIATQTAGTANGYDKIGGWSAWATQSMMVGVPAASGLTSTSVNTWLRGQVDLTTFIGKQIRVRFVASVPGSTGLADGQYLDEIAFTYSPAQIAVPMVDNAQSTANWVTEGTWGLGKDYFIGSGSSSVDFGSFSWVGTYYDCEQMLIVGENAGMCTGSTTTIMDNILKRNTDYTAASGFTNAGGKIGPETSLSQIDDINFNWVDGTSRPLGNAAIPGLAPAIGFDDTYVVRWKRQVTLNPGVTYNFSTISDDGVRLMLGTSMAGLAATGRSDNGLGGSSYIINNWGNHGPSLNYGTFTVGASPVNTTLTLEYFENTGGAQIILNATSTTFSFTDSPNTGSAPPYTVATSIFPGNSSLMLNGYVDLSDATKPNKTLAYQRLYDLAANNSFYVEVSTNGGFTWTQIATETLTGATTRLPPGQNWQQQSVSLNAYAVAKVMIRFRLDTRSASATGDGVYLTDIRVSQQ